MRSPTYAMLRRLFLALILLSGLSTALAMPLYVETPTGAILTLDVESNNTIEYVKVEIQGRGGFPPDRQRLFWAGGLLDDERTLADYNIQYNSTLLLRLTLRCGAAEGVAAVFPPSADLCNVGGTASAVGLRPEGDAWAWSCTDIVDTGQAAKMCEAPTQAIATGTGSGSAAVSGGTWEVDRDNTSGFIAAAGHPKSPAFLPDRYTFPHGLFQMELMSGTPGSSATVVIRYPTPLPPGTVYLKFDPVGQTWAPFAGAAVNTADNTITLTLQDGGPGDGDGAANGRIVDPGGPAVLALLPGASVAVPGLSGPGLFFTAGLLLLAAAWPARRRLLGRLPR